MSEPRFKVGQILKREGLPDREILEVYYQADQYRHEYRVFNLETRKQEVFTQWDLEKMYPD